MQLYMITFFYMYIDRWMCVCMCTCILVFSFNFLQWLFLTLTRKPTLNGCLNSNNPSPQCSLSLALSPWGSVALEMTYFPHHEALGIPELRSDSAWGWVQEHLRRSLFLSPLCCSWTKDWDVVQTCLVTQAGPYRMVMSYKAPGAQIGQWPS